MIIELTQKQERLLRKAMQQQRFRSIDEALDAALYSILPASDMGEEDAGSQEEAVAPPVPRHTPAEAAARIRELRKGKNLPEGMTIRSMIDEGRA